MFTLLAILVVAPASAGGVGLSMGLDSCINDPFLNRYGVRLGGAYAPREQVAFEGTVAFYPDLGEADWKPLTSQLVNNNHVSPDLSPMDLQAHARVHIYAARAEFGAWWGSIDLFGGFGVTHTNDDLEALQQEGDAYAEATASQWHPSPSWGVAYQLVSDVGSGMAIGGRLRWDHFLYVETVSSTTLQMKHAGFIGLEAMLWL